LIRTYAKMVALVLAALTVAGITILNWRSATNFYHAGLALLFGYVGFFAPNPGTTRQILMGLGVLVLLTKALMVLALFVGFGHLEHGPIALTCLVVGVASILAAKYLPNGQNGDT
jgi:hypothetical protein